MGGYNRDSGFLTRFFVLTVIRLDDIKYKKMIKCLNRIYWVTMGDNGLMQYSPSWGPLPYGYAPARREAEWISLTRHMN